MSNNLERNACTKQGDQQHHFKGKTIALLTEGHTWCCCSGVRGSAMPPLPALREAGDSTLDKAES